MKTASGLAPTLLLLALALAGCATPPGPFTAAGTMASGATPTAPTPMTRGDGAAGAGDASAAGLTTTTAAPTAAAPQTISAPRTADSAAALLPAQGAVSFAIASPEIDEPPVLLDAPKIGDDSDLWVRVRRGLALAPLEDDPRIAKWTRYYADRPDYVQRMTERGGRYLFHIVEEVEKRGMPSDLALLPFIESAFNPQAVSHARAAGMWQFMPATGRDFELRQNLFRDDRRDVLASTTAALDYLQLLHRQFGEWHLALAAYNWGQGNVQRAIARNQKAGQPADYASLRMPEETRNYVPKLLAVRAIIEQPADFALTLPPLANHPFFLSMPIVRDIDVALVARLADLPLDEFQALNPQLNKPVILAAGTPQVLLPYDNAHRFATHLAAHRGPMASWTAWTAPRTLKPAAAAKLVGMSEKQLRQINRIPPRMLVKAGSTLLVPRAAGTQRDVTEHVANTAMLALAPEARPKRKLRVRAGKSGDTVVAVARRYRVSAAEVARWNGVSTSARFKAGSTIVVMVAPKAARSAKRSKGAKAPTRQAKVRPGTHVAQR